MRRSRMSLMFIVGLGAVVGRLVGAPLTGAALRRGREVVRRRDCGREEAELRRKGEYVARCRI